MSSPVPINEKIVDGNGFVSRIWSRFFSGLGSGGGGGTTPVGGFTPGQMIAADGSGDLSDATNTNTEVANTVTKAHTRAHAITGTSDHTSSATAGKMLKADANGLPVDASNTDTEVSGAVTNSHAKQHSITSTDDHTFPGGTTNFLREDGTFATPSAGSTSPVGITGRFRNLKVSATGKDKNVSITADEVMLEDGSNNYTTVRSVSLTLDTTASGANGLDTGSLAGSTWYALYVISNGSTTAALMSTSATAPTLPAGYTYFTRVGWTRTDATANKYPKGFTQYGRRVQYLVASGSNLTALPIIVSGASGSVSVPTWSAVAVGNYVPSTASVIFLVPGNAGSMIVAPNNAYGAMRSVTNPPFLSFDANSTNCEAFNMMLESTNIYWASSAASSSLACSGWEDNL